MNIKKYCPYCASGLLDKYVEGKTRLFCPSCNKPIYENPLPATAAVVINDKNEVLLVKRKVEPQKGNWCLPGGFIELDETPESGCLRELQEETGLDAEIDRLIGVYPSKSPIHNWVLVIGFAVKNMKGTILPGDDCEDAVFFKLEPEPTLAFKSHQSILRKALNSDRSRKPGLKTGDFGAYVITSGDHREIARQACRAGARILQYRDKTSTRKELLRTAQTIREITAQHNTLFIMNDFIDIALLAAADGVHLGQDDIPLAQARKLVPLGFIIGCSTHSLAQALEAEKSGADYIGSGPVFATPTKEHYTPIGIDCVKQVVQTVHIPVVAIGGLNLQNIPGLYAAGIRNFAMVRAFQENTGETIKKINDMTNPAGS